MPVTEVAGFVRLHFFHRALPEHGPGHIVRSMKIAILFIAIFITLPALTEASEMSLLVKDFRIVPPGNDYSQSPLLPKSGNCYIKGADLRYQDIDSVVFFHIIERGNVLAGMEQSINVKGKDIVVDIGTCGKTKGYSHSVTANADGSKTLNVKCSGNGLEGQGSGQMSITVNRKNVITAYSLKKRAGWYENFRAIEMSCKF